MIKDTVPIRMKRRGRQAEWSLWMGQEAATKSLQHIGGDEIADRS